ncbi:hypothetical protein [Natrinema halophilum]|uniref:Uncharacterized protein n=1 Tax=Natrinema halophilum TaxID=1699371 RepID=A0A7D5GGL0_9EURY|nr:hypothetical protein [Natrinema halophilum]QLG48334.1 hypothetical protein HYG82_05460 [Natrinema halophilum]
MSALSLLATANPSPNWRSSIDASSNRNAVLELEYDLTDRPFATLERDSSRRPRGTVRDAREGSSCGCVDRPRESTAAEGAEQMSVSSLTL